MGILQKNPLLHQKPPFSRKKPDEAPWPRNFQIAGYCAAGVGIPYSLAWYISTQQDIREYIPLSTSLWNVLRHHFGEVEEDALSYPETIVGSSSSLAQAPQAPFKFEDEPPLRERQQQEEIQHVLDSPLSIHISSVSNKNDTTTDDDTTTTMTVPGSTSATMETLRNLITTKNTSSSTSSSSPQKVPLAVHFPSDLPQDEHTDVEDSSTTTTTMTTNTTFVMGDDDHESSQSSSTLSSSSSLLLPDICTIYSMWYYMSGTSPTTTTTQNSTTTTTSASSSQRRMMTPHELEESKLTWEIQQLEQQLQDPSCTRDRDELQLEYQTKKSILRKRVWKRRLGIKQL